MELGYILSLVILGVSLIVLIVMGIVAWKKIQPTLKNIEETQETLDGHITHFTSEAETLQSKVEHLMNRVDNTKNVAEINLQRFEEFSEYASTLSHSLAYLKEHSGDYSKGIAENTYTELKTDGPRLAKTVNLAMKGTIDKQKKRRKAKEEKA